MTDQDRWSPTMDLTREDTMATHHLSTEQGERIKTWLIERLGLDPATTRNLSAEQSGDDSNVIVTWEGRATIPAAEFLKAFNGD